MRSLVVVVLCASMLVGCGGGESGLEGRIDSLQTANQSLERQVQRLRDSVRAPSSETTLSPSIYFPSGSAWIPTRGRRHLDQHAEALKQEYQNADFRIQGYTDPVPIGPSLRDTYPSNWYLAAQRAAAVAHYLNKNHDIQTESLEIEAFGPRADLGPNETPERQREERRVDIVVEEGM